MTLYIKEKLIEKKFKEIVKGNQHLLYSNGIEMRAEPIVVGGETLYRIFFGVDIHGESYDQETLLDLAGEDASFGELQNVLRNVPHKLPVVYDPIFSLKQRIPTGGLYGIMKSMKKPQTARAKIAHFKDFKN